MPLHSWFHSLRNTRPFALLFSTLLCIASSAQTQKPIFPTPLISSTTAVAGMATGDFNGDGLPDTASITSSSITVLLNQGANNAPAPVVTSGFSCTPQSPLVAADMNKDNKLDLVFTCKEGFVVVLLGKGDGTFEAPSYYAVPGVNNIASPVDLNGDGYPDIAVSTAVPQANPAVAVLLNQGSAAAGSLAPPKTYPPVIGITAGNSFSYIAAGDFNGDGKQDIFVGSSVLEVFYGNGDGTLQTAQFIGTSTGVNGVFASADFNQDGIADIAYIGNASSSTNPQSLVVILGTSSGQFTSPIPPSPLPSFQTYQAILPFQTTSTSKTVDLAVVGPASTTIFINAGASSFIPGLTYAITGTPFPETSSDGKTNLLFSTATGATLLLGNGDGTFQGLPTLPVGPTGFVAADFNSDGLTDVVSTSATGNLVTALGRGNGTFLVTNQTSAHVSANQFLVAGDFNADGHPDVVDILPTPIAQGGDSQLFFYKGNGDGSFQSTTSVGIDLHITGAFHAVTGDFNGDGHLDLVISSYSTDSNQPGQSLTFFPGNGDGTFGTPVTFSTLTSSGSPSSLLLADLNNDGKPDLVWNSSVYLGNGDGTFRQQPLSVVDTPSTIGGFNGPLAIGDLNGDGIPDIVVQPPSVGGNTPGPAVYAGIGDGTFQTTPLFAVPTLPSGTALVSALIGDVNADGHPDLLIEIRNPADLSAAVNLYLADGKGNFTADLNTYTAGSSIEGLPAMESPIATFARLNNQAHALTNDNAPDFLTFTSGGATSLLNQLNPAPATPSPLPSQISIVTPIGYVAPSRPITLTASVKGSSPTGSVSFASNGVALGTVTVINGLISLSATFPAPGTYTITATYSGDSNNQPSSATLALAVAPVVTTTHFGLPSPTPGANQPVAFLATVSGDEPTGTLTFSVAGATIGTVSLSNSNASFSYAFPTAGTVVVTATYSGDAANLPSSSTDPVTVMVPDFAFSSTGAVATITAGQSATTTLNVFSEYGYHGTINFSCSGLTAGEACIFSPTTVTPNADGSVVSSTIVTSTTAPTSAHLSGLAQPLQRIAWSTLFFLALSPKRIWRLNRRLMRSSMLTLLLAIALLHLSACSSSSPSGTQSPGTPNQGTPKGTQTITVTAADSAGGPSHSISLQLTVQ